MPNAMGKDWAARLRPMPLVDPVRGFVLFTNAKCGGTTLKAWFLDTLGFAALHRRPVRLVRRFGARYALRHLRQGRRMLPGGSVRPSNAAVREATTFYRNSYCARRMAAGTEGLVKFAVVRNPYDRVVSGFADKFCGADHGEDWVQEVVRAAGTDGAITFEQFLGYLETVDEAACNPHWRRQTYVLEGVEVDAFVRIEHLRADFERLGYVVGTAHFGQFDVARQAGTRVSAPMAEERDVGEMTNREIMARGAVPEPAQFLTEAARARVRRIYESDFEQLPYDP